MAVGLSSTALISKVKEAESDPPFPSVTVSVNVPIESDAELTLALGEKVIPSS